MPTDTCGILVTGANGFVGRHLAAAVTARGGRVRGAVRRTPTGGETGVSEWAEVGDIGPATDWTDALRGVDTVIHLAALAHRTDPRRQPAEKEYMAVNAAGTRRLAEAVARNGGIRRFIFVSSIGAVTESSVDDVDELAIPRPVSPYGRSKWEAEEAVRETLGGTVTAWCILRPVLVYGPGNPGNMGRLFRLVRTGLPLPLGGIRNRRSFVYVGNLVDAIEAVTAAPSVLNRVFHVADEEIVSTPELIRLVAASGGSKARLWPAPKWSLAAAARCGDAAARLGLSTGLDSYSLRRLEDSLAVSSRSLREATGWRPRASLAEGLRATLSVR